MTEISVLTSLYRCEEYLTRFFESVLQIENLNEVEFVFIHNDPLNREKQIITTFLQNHPQINYQYAAVPREGLYASWNRGITMAKGDFIAVWNVDDIRMPDSLKLQAEALKAHKDIDLLYGNRYTIKHLLDNTMSLEKTKDINLSSWNNYFQEGAFLMWRKTVHAAIGYFDEQFKIGGDAEFWYRLTESRKVLKISVPVGIYLREKGKGISKSFNFANCESIILGLRYGFYPRMVIHPFGWRKAIKMINPKAICYLGRTQKRKILKYHSTMIYLMSFFYLLFLAVPWYILSNLVDLNQYNYHYFKKLFTRLSSME